VNLLIAIELATSGKFSDIRYMGLFRLKWRRRNATTNDFDMILILSLQIFFDLFGDLGVLAGLPVLCISFQHPKMSKISKIN